MKQPSIFALYEKYRNEDPHTIYVAALALQIFDAIRVPYGFLDQDRIILETAAQLHDIGYFTDPPNHAAVSTDIVLKEGVEGLTVEQCKEVAAVIRLHQRNYKKALRHPVFKELNASLPMLKKLGAILRVADGLDHGHIQDTVILKVKPNAKRSILVIRSGWYKGNLKWAESKADLWNKVMPASLRLMDKAPSHSSTDYEDVACPADSPVAVARKLLYSQYRIIMENREHVLHTDGMPDPEYLHDIRVALRRFRAVLDLFEKPLKHTAAPSINIVLDKLGDELGIIRDSNVWINFLERESRKKAVIDDPAWSGFLRRQYELDAALNDKLRKILSRDDFEKLIYMLVEFLKSELPELMRKKKEKSIHTFSAQRLQDVFTRLDAYRKTIQIKDSEQMHLLRKWCRKERYWAEFLTPILKGSCRKLAKRLKKVADTLGDIHDMDVHLEVLKTSVTPVPAALITDMKHIRKRTEKSFRRAWNNLTDKAAYLNDYSGELC